VRTAEHSSGCPHRHAEVDFACDSSTAPAEDSEHGNPEPCPGSCVDKCVLVAAPRVQLELDGSAVLPPVAMSAWQAPLDLGPSPAEFAARHAATYPPPERIHLLYQLLLI